MTRIRRSSNDVYSLGGNLLFNVRHTAVHSLAGSCGSPNFLDKTVTYGNKNLYPQRSCLDDPKWISRRYRWQQQLSPAAKDMPEMIHQKKRI